MLRKKLEISVSAVEEAQMAFSNTERNINQLKHDIMTKKVGASEESIS